MASDSFVGEGLAPSPYREALERAEKAERRVKELLSQLEGAKVRLSELEWMLREERLRTRYWSARDA